MPALIHLLSFVAAGAAISGVSQEIGSSKWAADLAAFTLPLLPPLALVPALPSPEGWAILGIIIGLSLSFLPGHSVGVAGLFFGIAISARLQSIPWSFIGLAIILIRQRPQVRSFGSLIGGLVIGSHPWWLKNGLLLRQPFAPFGWRHCEGISKFFIDVGSPIYQDVGWISMVHTALANLVPHLSYLGPLLLAALLAAVQGRRKGYWVLALAVVGGIAAWQFTSLGMARYLAPSLPALLVLVAASSGLNQIGKVAAGLALCCASVISLVFSLSELRRVDAFAIVAGSQKPFERSGFVNSPAAAFASARSLPASARVLFIGETRGYSFPRRFIVPTAYDRPLIADPIERASSAAEVREWLIQKGFTHLLVNWGELRRLSVGYPVLPWRSEAGLKKWNDLLLQLSPPVISENRVAIFAVRGDFH